MVLVASMYCTRKNFLFHPYVLIIPGATMLSNQWACTLSFMLQHRKFKTSPSFLYQVKHHQMYIDHSVPPKFLFPKFSCFLSSFSTAKWEHNIHIFIRFSQWSETCVCPQINANSQLFSPVGLQGEQTSELCFSRFALKTFSLPHGQVQHS